MQPWTLELALAPSSHGVELRHPLKEALNLIGVHYPTLEELLESLLEFVSPLVDLNPLWSFPE